MLLTNRIPEPELMEDPEQVRAYALGDFDEPHSRMLELFQQIFPGPLRGDILDLGCGPGDISYRFARAYPEARVLGVDGSAEMLAMAEELRRDDRVRFLQSFLPSAAIPQAEYAAIVSNSLLHHLHEPSVLWTTIKSHGRPGTLVFVKDLVRPESTEAAQRIVEVHAGGEPEVLQRDVYNSLLAAFRPEEVEAQLQEAGLPQLAVRAVGDRHLLVSGRL